METAIHDSELENFVPIQLHISETAAHEHALVLLAAGVVCCVDRHPGGYELLVELTAVPRALNEIRSYDEEQAREADFMPPLEPERETGLIALFLWSMALVAGFAAQQEFPALTTSWANSSWGIFREHQWQRPFTALFLHGNAGHLISNLAASWLLFPLLASRVGAGWAVALAIIAGTVGNFIVSWLSFPEFFLSIGASTAVFGSLGALSALRCATIKFTGKNGDLRRFALPLCAGIALLGLYGGGGGSPEIDVAGHVCGFVSGLVTGALWHFFIRPANEARKTGNATVAPGAPI